MRDDDIHQLLSYDDIDEDGSRIFRSEVRPWDTAIIVPQRWVQKELTKATCTWATSISSSCRGRRMIVASLHLSDSWNSTEEEFDAALDEVTRFLLDLGLQGADVIVGIDANANHAENDMDEVMARRGAQRDATSRTRAWVDMVRLLNLMVANSFEDTPELRHEGTLFHQRRTRWSDWILTNLRFEESKVCLQMPCRSDHRPVIMRSTEVDPITLRFRRPTLSLTSWMSTPQSAARVARFLGRGDGLQQQSRRHPGGVGGVGE